jgi:hypothetical protein
MRNYLDFLSESKIELPGCPNPYIIQSLNNAAREFCKQTQIWQKIITMGLSTDTSEYIIPVQDDSMVSDIVYFGRKVENSNNPVKYNDLTKHKATEDELDWAYPGWREATSDSAGITKWGQTLDQLGFFIYPTPKISYGNGVKLKYVLYPTRDASEVPNILFDEYAEIIAAGAKAELQAMDNKEWSNLEASARSRRKFINGIGTGWRKVHMAGDNRVRNRRLGS